ncbi:four helix bundle protein [Dawidia soli]|uniref:Four helix bundle protein n=1 Tax=Dawidia soli TaxID=2782352 RepID=A0AAP2GKN6_9BACT|nr:four helix bundle protein [Dawidia soli]
MRAKAKHIPRSVFFFALATSDQLRRAAFSVVLNLTEGSGRFIKPDRKKFLCRRSKLHV